MIKDILEMIEKCDPADSAGLNEIDVMVFSYINDIDYIKEGYKKYYELIFLPKYTRSRDALKSIRPEGWGICVAFSASEKDFVVCSIYNRDMVRYETQTLKTEELAELHCILQAIEHERGLK